MQVAYAIKIVFCHDFPLRHSPTNAVIYPIHLEAAIAIYDARHSHLRAQKSARQVSHLGPLWKIFHIPIKVMDDVVQIPLFLY